MDFDTVKAAVLPQPVELLRVRQRLFSNFLLPQTPFHIPIIALSVGVEPISQCEFFDYCGLNPVNLHYFARFPPYVRGNVLKRLNRKQRGRPSIGSFNGVSLQVAGIKGCSFTVLPRPVVNRKARNRNPRSPKRKTRRSAGRINTTWRGWCGFGNPCPNPSLAADFGVPYPNPSMGPQLSGCTVAEILKFREVWAGQRPVL